MRARALLIACIVARSSPRAVLGSGGDDATEATPHATRRDDHHHDDHQVRLGRR